MHNNKWAVAVALILTMAASAACGDDAVVETVSAIPTPLYLDANDSDANDSDAAASDSDTSAHEDAQTEAPEPTALPEPTTLPEPTALPEPTQPPAPTATPSPVLFDQASEPLGGAQTSQRSDGPQSPVATYDDFVIRNGGEIATVVWDGVYCKTILSGEPEPTASAFTIAFYPDLDGKPDTLAPIASERFSIDQVNETRGEPAGLACGDQPTVWAFYDYEAQLATPFVAVADQTYWILIQAHTPDFETFWGWRSTFQNLEATNPSLQEFAGAWTELPESRVFELRRTD